MNNELEIRRITEQVLKDQNLWNLAEIYKKEHNIFRGTHEGFASGGISWDAILGKPSTFPPSSHTHPGTDITSIVAEAAKLTASGFSLSSLIANNKVPDSDKVDGYHANEASTISTVPIRNASGDIFTRLFRSEYTSTNPTINYIMTQKALGVGADNYMRPSTPAQIAAGLTSALQSYFIRSNADDNVSGNTEWQDNFSARFGNSADFRIWHNTSHHYLRGYKHGANIYIQSENASGTNRTLATFDPDNYRAQFYQISTSNILYANYKIDSLWTYNYTTAQYANLYIFSSGVFARESSSRRIKQNITDLEVDPSLLYKLRPVSFQSKCEMDDKNIRRIGLIAEEVDEHIPGIIIKNEVFERAKTGRDRSKRIGTGRVEVEGINYNSLIVLLLAGHQRHEERIKALEN